MQFRKKVKLSPRFVGPFMILEYIGPMAYYLALSSEFMGLHDVFHVFMLKRYHHDPSHIIPHQETLVQANMTYEGFLTTILD